MARERKRYTEPICPGVDPGDSEGLTCPECGCHHFFVVYTKPSLGGRIIRRRECRNCGHRITTVESAKGE